MLYCLWQYGSVCSYDFCAKTTEGSRLTINRYYELLVIGSKDAALFAMLLSLPKRHAKLVTAKRLGEALVTLFGLHVLILSRSDFDEGFSLGECKVVPFSMARGRWRGDAEAVRLLAGMPHNRTTVRMARLAFAGKEIA